MPWCNSHIQGKSFIVYLQFIAFCAEPSFSRYGEFAYRMTFITVLMSRTEKLPE